MLEDRKLEVLRAIVEDYVATQEPVGLQGAGRAAQPGRLAGHRSATTWPSLEDEGYIAQPHTSAGRIPTDKGYRLFVDRLVHGQAAVRRPSAGRSSFLDGAVDLDDVVDPHGPAARPADPPGRGRAVPLADPVDRAPRRAGAARAATRLLVVLITNTGRVEQRVVEAGADWSPRRACSRELRAQLNAGDRRRPAARRGRPAGRAADRFTGRPADTGAPACCRPCWRALVEEHEERVVLGGTANLARFGPDFPQTIQPVLEALEEQVVLLRLLGEGERPVGAQVRIGHENPHEGLTSTSVVSVGYGAEREMRRQARRARSDPDGLPRHDGSGARSGPVRRQIVGLRSDRLPDERHRRPTTTQASASPATRPRGDQEGLPQAGPPAAPGREPGGPRRSSRRSPGLRGALRPAEARAARPGRRPVLDRRRLRVRASASPTSWTPSSAGAAAARGPRPRSGAARTR